MIINTYNYGDIECSEKDLINFSDGILGFPELKQYLLLSYDDDDTILVLQSAECPEISFAVLNPLSLCPDYAPSLTPEELVSLGVENSEELSYYVICIVKENYLDNTVNLKCPLVINPTTLKGIQVIMEGTPYHFRHPLSSFSHISTDAEVGNRGDTSC